MIAPEGMQWFEIGTIGSTPIYTKSVANKKNLGKLYTQEELDKTLKDEREACALICDEISMKYDDYVSADRAAETIRGRDIK